MTNKEIKSNVFQEIWEKLTSQYLQNSEGLRPESPHILIKELIIEIQENKLANSDNRKYFENQIKTYLERDYFVKGNGWANFKLIIRNMHNARLGYLLEICRSLEEEFESGSYLDCCLSEIVRIVNEPQQVSTKIYEDLRYLAQVTINEFMLNGYSIKDIQMISLNAFDTFHETPLGIHTKYPHNIERLTPTRKKKKSLRTYNKEVVRYMKTLTIENRILGIKEILKKKQEPVIYLFRIEGLKSKIDFEFSDITFFPSSSDNIFNKNNFFQDETDEQIAEDYIQAAVKIEHLMPFSSVKVAISKLETALDLIAISKDLRVPLRVLTDS